MIQKQYPNIFKPVKIRGVWFRNRICSAPNMLSQTDHVGVTSYYVDYLENKAMGGCAEVVVSEMPVDEYGAHHKSVPLDEYGATIIGEMCAAHTTAWSVGMCGDYSCGAVGSARV